MPKNILIVLTSDFPFNKGEPFFESEIKYLQDKFDQIYLLSANGNKNSAKREVAANVEYTYFSCSHNRIKYIIKGMFSTNSIFNSKEAKGKKKLTAWYLKGRNYEIGKKSVEYISNKIDKSANYYVYSYWLTFGIAAVILRKHIEEIINRPVRLISRCHRYDIYSELQPFNYHPFQKQIINLLDNIYPCSEHGTIYLKSKYPESSHKIICSRLFSNDYGIKKYIDQPIKHIVTASGFRKVKRLPLFAEAFSLIAKKRNDIYWDAMGDGPELENVKVFIKDNHLESRVTFYGQMNNKDIYDFYLNNDVFLFVNISSSEGIPVSIMEASSFGIPTLATDVGGTSEIVSGENGCLMEEELNKESLANYIERMLDLDQQSYLNMRKEARRKWNNLYNADKNLPAWYKTIINENKGDK